MRLKLYDLLVNRNSTIRAKYHGFIEKHAGMHRAFPVISWAYLALLNVVYGIFHISCEEKTAAAFESGQVREKLFPYSAAEAARMLCSADEVSFDVFDTLIVRPFEKPHDLFYIVGEKLDIPDFCGMRINAERAARHKRKGEVSLADIYEELSFLTGISAEKGMKAEMQTELELCRANPFMLEVWNNVKAYGKSIIVTTDMYLPKEFICRLLEKNGFMGFRRIYVSCEEGCGKYDCGIFRLIKKDKETLIKGEAIVSDARKSATESVVKRFNQRFHNCGASVSHIGDNRRSDKINAENSGISAVYYPNINSEGRLYRPKNMSPIIGSAYSGIVNKRLYCGGKCSPAYEYGYKCGGLLILGFCGFIHNTALGKNADRILFFSRDGYIIKKVYDMLYPDERTEYVYWSRAAAAKLCRDIFPQDWLRRFIDQKVNKKYTLGEVFRSMGISGEKLPFDIGTLLTADNAEAVKNELLSRRAEISEEYSEADRGAEEYFSSVLEGCSRAVTVDCGWAGSGNILLEAYVNRVMKRNVEFTGVLAGTNTANQSDSGFSEAYLLSGRLAAYCFSSAENRGYYESHCPAKKHNVYFEMLFGAPQPSVKGFDRNGAVFDTECENQELTSEIHRGELDFIGDYLDEFGSLPYMMNISGSDAYAPFAAALSDGGKYLNSIFESAVFDELADGRKEKMI